MKRYLLLLALAICQVMFTSCGNKNDDAIDKIENIVSKMEKTDNPDKLLTLFEEAKEILNKMDEKSLTKEQERRLTKIGKDLAKVYAEKLGSMLMGSLGIASDAMNIFGSSAKDDIEEEIDTATDELNDDFESLNSMFDDEEDE